MKSIKHTITCCALMILIGMSAVEVKAEEAQSKENIQAEMKADKTGTNPINFTYELRFYNEYQWLNTKGDGHQNISTVEYRMPFMDGKWQFRTRTRGVMTKSDLNDNGRTDIDGGGWGDTDFRFLTVPYLDMANKFAFAVGFETFLDTAQEDSLGTGTTSLGPQVIGVFLKPFGGFFDLIAPAYQHKFSVDENDGRNEIEQGFIDVFALKMSKDKQSWLMINPQFILDYENDQESMLLDIEVGTMVNKLLSSEAYKGHSVYVRPSVGVGGDRSTKASLEAGYKIIW